MRLRFRHDIRVEGVSHKAGTRADVPETDETWRLVNEGHADLEPPPGQAGQPQVPDWVQGKGKAPADVEVTPAESARLTAPPQSPAAPLAGSESGAKTSKADKR